MDKPVLYTVEEIANLLYEPFGKHFIPSISLSSELSHIAPYSKLETEERRTCRESGINRRSA